MPISKLIASKYLAGILVVNCVGIRILSEILSLGTLCFLHRMKDYIFTKIRFFGSVQKKLVNLKVFYELKL